MIYQCTVYCRDTNTRFGELADSAEQAARFAAISAVQAGLVAHGLVTVDVADGGVERQFRAIVEITHSAQVTEVER